jgi:hypothetical protein
MYSPFIVGGSFSGEEATVCCHLFIGSSGGTDEDSAILDYHPTSYSQAQLISLRHHMFSWIATGTPRMNGQCSAAHLKATNTYDFELIYFMCIKVKQNFCNVEFKTTF